MHTNQKKVSLNTNSHRNPENPEILRILLQTTTHNLSHISTTLNSILRMRTCFVLLIAVVASLSVYAVAESPIQDKPMKPIDRYMQTVFNIHFDHHASQISPIGRDADAEEIKRILRLSNPGMVQYHSKGHPGYATYKTDLGVPSQNLEKDMMALYRQVCDDLDIPFSIYHSTLFDMEQANRHPEWVRKKADGTLNEGCNKSAMCCNAGYVEGYLIPVLVELARNNKPDGFWFDGDVWSVVPCWCDTCRKMFKEKAGREAPPADVKSPDWNAWAEFHRQSFENYHHRVADAIHAINPDIMICGNWSYTLRQPDEVPEHIAWLSGDVPTWHSLLPGAFEGRFLQWRGKPYDIMTWNQAYDWQNPPKHKSTQHLLQEGALILSMGARWFVWDNPTDADALEEFSHRQMAVLSEFAHKRADLVHDTQSEPWVAVLHGESAHYSKIGGSSFQYGENESFQSLRGLAAALDLEGIHYDILNEETLIKRAPLYRVIILSDQFPVAASVADALRKYVMDGGALIFMGRNRVKASEDADSDALNDLMGAHLGASLGQRQLALRAEDLDDGRLGGMVGPISLRLVFDAVLITATRTQTLTGDDGKAGVITNHLGKGRVITVLSPVAQQYDKERFPALRAWISDIVRNAAPPVVTIDGGSRVLVTVRDRKDEARIVNLVNLWVGAEENGADIFIEEVPVRNPLTVKIESKEKPRKVRFIESRSHPDWSWSKGQVTVNIPRLHIHEAVVMEY